MKIDSLYKRKGLMPSFYEVRSFFNLDDWYALNPKKIFKSFKEKVTQDKYKKDIKTLFNITKMLNKETYLIHDKNNKKSSYAEYDNNRKIITMYMSKDPFDDFAAIAFHEMSHLLQYNYEKMKDSAFCAKYDYRISVAWMIERCADMSAKKICKYVYPDMPYNSYMFNNYKTIESVQLFYISQDSFWQKEHKTNKNFVVDDLNILKK